MKKVILVSHGDFAEGLKSALEMFTGEQSKDVIAVGLRKGEAADQFGQRFAEVIEQVDDTAELIILADIVGGSPLTTACNILAQKERLTNVIILGGMNFPMALNSVLFKDSLDGTEFVERILAEATTAVQQFKLTVEDDEDDI